MTKEELIKNQFPNDEFLQSSVLQIVDKCVADLEKENAELRKESEVVSCNTFCRDNHFCLQERLTKAKEIIKGFLNADSELDMLNAQWKAEQFLNSEVEK